MKATWITSSIAGLLFGSLIYFLERDGEKVDMALIAPVFFPMVFIGVVGLAQTREFYAERKRRGLGLFGIMMAPEDFTRFYFPGWGRMLVWVAAVLVAIFGLKAWFR